MAIKVGGITVIDDSRNLTNISGGSISGIQSGGQTIGAGATVLNFVGAGNTFAYNAVTNTIDITIASSSGGGGGGGGEVGAGLSATGISTSGFWANPNIISESQELSSSNVNYFVIGPVTVGAAATITVGAGSTFRII